MNTLNTPTQAMTTVNHLVDYIADTCDALISALEYTTEQVSQYGWGIIQSFDSEYVDVVIRTLLQLRGHIARLGKELNKGLIRSHEDLQLLLEGIQDIDDKLTVLMRENGNIRNNFSFWIQEIRNSLIIIKENLIIA